MKKYSHVLIALLIVGAYATLFALILGGVQSLIVPIVVAVVLIVKVVVISIVVGSDRPDEIPAIFNGLGNGLAKVIGAAKQFRNYK